MINVNIEDEYITIEDTDDEVMVDGEFVAPVLYIRERELDKLIEDLQEARRNLKS